MNTQEREHIGRLIRRFAAGAATDDLLILIAEHSGLLEACKQLLAETKDPVTAAWLKSECEAEPVRTEMIEPSQPWRTFSLDFTVPADCHTMMVQVRRTASLQIDNQLGGELWLAELGLTPTTIAIAPLKEVDQ